MFITFNYLTTGETEMDLENALLMLQVVHERKMPIVKAIIGQTTSEYAEAALIKTIHALRAGAPAVQLIASGLPPFEAITWLETAFRKLMLKGEEVKLEYMGTYISVTIKMDPAMKFHE